LGAERDGLLYVPSGYDVSLPAPFALMLHGAFSGAREGLAPFLDLADEVGLILLAPESRSSRTWGSVLDGPDLEFIDRALGSVFSHYAVDTLKLAVCGFSDGASYALSLGLTNGDLFTHAIAFSPGRVLTGERRGAPALFVSHGTEDETLRIGETSRQIVPQLRREGYDVRYEEFNGSHEVPPEVAREALSWFVGTEAG
jgi:phospholipase/carboxylesterase